MKAMKTIGCCPEARDHTTWRTEEEVRRFSSSTLLTFLRRIAFRFRGQFRLLTSLLRLLPALRQKNILHSSAEQPKLMTLVAELTVDQHGGRVGDVRLADGATSTLFEPGVECVRRGLTRRIVATHIEASR